MNLFCGKIQYGFLGSTTGNPSHDDEWTYTDKIYVSPNTTLNIRSDTKQNIFIYEYTENSYIGYYSRNPTTDFTTSNTCSYIRIQFKDCPSVNSIVVDYSINKLQTSSNLLQSVQGVESNKKAIAQCNNKLRSALSSKDVVTTKYDKMSNLIDNIPSISTGKKWAEGTITSNITFPYGSSTWHSYKVNTNIDFVPTHVILNCAGIRPANYPGEENLSINSKIANSDTSYALVTNGNLNMRLYISIQSDGFTIHIRSNDGNNSLKAPITWEAYR